MQLEVVLHTEYGGFSFDTEMALWLIENRGWTLLKETDFDYNKKDYPINTLVECSISDYFYHPNNESIELRTNKDLIDCVRTLQEKHDDDEYPDKYYGHIHKLSIINCKINLEVENYHDGKEKLHCWIQQDY